MSARVFLALPLGAEAGTALMEEVVAALGGDVQARRAYRLPRPEGLHLTLYFLGPLERERVTSLWSAVEGAVAGRPAPRLVLSTAGAFPRPGRERVLWIGAAEVGPGGALEGLRGAVLEALDACGIDTEAERRRPFRPHVTVARPRGSAPAPAAFHALAPGRPWSPAGVVLFESVTGSGPARYVPLAMAPLRAV